MADVAGDEIPPEFLTKEEKAQKDKAQRKRDEGWQTVPSRVKPKKTDKDSKGAGVPGGKAGSGSVFASLEDQAKQRRAQIEARKAEETDGPRDEDDSEEEELEFEGYGDKEKLKAAAAAGPEKKEKKPKKPRVSVAEAASKIDVEELSAFLLQINDQFATDPYVQLMRCADFFARAFTSVTPSVVNIPKIIKDSSMQKALEVPLSEVPEPVISRAATWLQSKPAEELGKFLMLLITVATEELLPQGKVFKGQPQAPPKAKVGMLVVLAILARKKPEIVLQQAEAIRANAAFHTLERLPLIAWLYGQVAQTDLALGMWLWSRNLLPLASGKGATPFSRDVILLFLENVLLKNPKKARSSLINGAARKGERIVTPAALDLYLRLSFPVPGARTKATDRFAANYQLIKDVALAGAARGKTSKPAAAQLFPLALKAVEQEPTRAEAFSIAVWCVAENDECFKQWEKHHVEELPTSVLLLEHMLKNWGSVKGQLEPIKHFKAFLRELKLKHNSAQESATGAHAKDLAKAESVRQRLEGKLSWVPACTKATVTLAIAGAMAYGFYLLSPTKNPWGWDGYLLLSRTHGPLKWPNMDSK